VNISSDGGLARWAVELAERKLAVQVPRRWAHGQATVAKARALATALLPDSDLLVAAVALHDIGFSPDLELADRSTFPTYDAARYLMSVDAPRRLTCLVANHVLGHLEGELRGYAPQMAQFEIESSPVSDAQWYCCLTVGPDGQDMSFDQRVREWRIRYADDQALQRFTVEAIPELEAAATRVQDLLAARTTSDPQD
jgi:hypothetical protein